MKMEKKLGKLAKSGLIGFGMILMVIGTSHVASSQTLPPPEAECAGYALKVKAVGVAGIDRGVYSFTSNLHPGALDPAPLLTTTVDVGGRRPSCLVAHFSAYVLPADNGVVFQVTVDGVPMEGHAPALPGTDILVPVVSESNVVDEYFDVPRMAAFNFFKVVDPGVHTVEVKVASCCSSPSEFGNVRVPSATLTLEHR